MARPRTGGKNAAPRSKAGAPPKAGAAEKRAETPSPRLPEIPALHPAYLLVALAAAVSILISASYVLYDTDLWTLLTGGRAIWSTHSIPATDLWTWRHYGEPQVLSSWGFRALLWPIWNAGGVLGLYLLRWTTTLAVFGLLWAAARAIGARGLVTPVVLSASGLIFRLRTDVRPETVAAVLLALELWILESRRSSARAAAEAPPARGPDRAWAIVAIAWAWANLHISYYLGLLVLLFYFLDGARARRGKGHAPPNRTLALVGLAALAISFVNPFGWKALWQPFEFILHWRNDPMFSTIGELRPLPWAQHLRSGLPLWLVLWPVLLLVHARRRGLDLAEVLCCGFFSYAAISSQRFAGIYALVAAPFVARDLGEIVARIGAPRTLANPWTRAAFAAVVALAIGVPEWTRPDLPLGMSIAPQSAPKAAGDFMAREGIGGRGFNESQLGGYLPFRFPGDRERLAFMTTQPEYATPEDRHLYIRSYVDPRSWRLLDERYSFDYAILARDQASGSFLLDFMDRDSNWVMVFTDDVAEVLVRRNGPLRDQAARLGYRSLPAGQDARQRLVASASMDPVQRDSTIVELERAVASSPENGSAHHLLGILQLMAGQLEPARLHLESALRFKPGLERVHELLARIAVAQKRPRDAARAFEEEIRVHGAEAGVYFHLGATYSALGDWKKARDAYRRELKRDPGHREAGDSLAVVEKRR